MNKAEKLANAHWKYVEGVIAAHDVTETVNNIIAFHYITAFIHGYKHGIEDGKCDCGGKCEDKDNPNLIKERRDSIKHKGEKGESKYFSLESLEEPLESAGPGKYEFTQPPYTGPAEKKDSLDEFYCSLGLPPK